MKAKFIVFEGPDGCGKSTIAKNVYELLKNEGNSIILTREPGGTSIGENIRSILLDVENPISIRTEALLMAASRAQIVEEVIKPSIESGIHVLCDRYVHSSLVYQGIGRKLGINNVMEINNFAMDSVLPDLTIYLNLSFDEALLRRGIRDVNDRMEAQSDEFHVAIHNGYEEIYHMYKESFNIVKIDASPTEKQVTEEAYKIVKNILEVKK